MNVRPSDCRSCDARENFQEGRLAGTIASDEADYFALADVERNFFERPEVGMIPVSTISSSAPSFGRRWLSWSEQARGGGGSTREQIAQGYTAFALADAVALAQILSSDDDVTHD